MDEDLPACMSWLREVLCYGPAEFDVVLTSAFYIGYTLPQLLEAKKELSIAEYRKGEQIWWRLPDVDGIGGEV